MLKKFLIPLVVMSMVFFVQCSDEQVMPDEGMLKAGKADKATGSLELEWKGGEKGSDQGNQPDDLLTFIEFNAHGAKNNQGPKGEVVYTVKNPDLTLHREITANVFGVVVDKDTNKAWIVALVVSDSKGCNGAEDGGHESGCTDEGGCSDEGSSHDGGCSHDDGGTGDDGCSDDEGGSGNGNPMSGKNCRIGQLIAMKLHDGGTPGTNGDGITWKWFDADGEGAPSIENIEEWPHLCKKTIIGGNLVVHK